MTEPFPQPEAPQSPKKRKKWPWITGGTVALIIVVGGSIGAATSGSPEPTPIAAAPTQDNTTTQPPEPSYVPDPETERVMPETDPSTPTYEPPTATYDPPSPTYTPEPVIPEYTPPPEVTHTIVYAVSTTGSGISSVTYVKPGFNMSQDTNISGNSWSTTVEWTGATTIVNMNAQNAGGGTISCSISRDGEVLVQNSSSGNYAVVSCMPPVDY